MNSRRALLPSLALVAASVCVLAGCPGTPTTTAYTPITGIVIRGASLVAGHGCGTGPGQVYKYAAVLTYIDEAGIPDTQATQYAGVFDCYADGLFSNLPVDSDINSLSFDVAIFAWDQASFPADLDCSPGEQGDAGFTACPGDNPSTVSNDEGSATWQTTCSATQQLGVSVLAVCGPLTIPGIGDAGAGDASDATAPGPGAPIVVDTHGFVASDGGTFMCGSAFQTVRATFPSGTASVDCPTPLTLSPTVAGAPYSFTVELFQSGTEVATAACQATASATSPVTATCAPATSP